jgi:uncharacterized protein YjbJ (UPF0337 family)
MTDNNRLEATGKNIQGKVQEALGDLTGDQKQKLEGKQKQAEASAEHAREDVKDAARREVDRY